MKLIRETEPEDLDREHDNAWLYCAMGCPVVRPLFRVIIETSLICVNKTLQFWHLNSLYLADFRNAQQIFKVMHVIMMYGNVIKFISLGSYFTRIIQ